MKGVTIRRRIAASLAATLALATVAPCADARLFNVGKNRSLELLPAAPLKTSPAVVSPTGGGLSGIDIAGIAVGGIALGSLGGAVAVTRRHRLTVTRPIV